MFVEQIYRSLSKQKTIFFFEWDVFALQEVCYIEISLEKSRDMRIVFLGTPDFAVASLQAMVEAGFQVVGVVTAPDKPSGRGLQMHQTPVKQFAVQHDIPVLQPIRLKDPDFLSALRAWNADIQVVVAFRMLPEVVWAMPPLGTFNLHGSLLPDYRGAAPIHWAVIRGEKETGVTTFFLQHSIDTGDILLQAKTPIGPEETTGDVYARLMNIGAQLVVETLEGIQNKKIKPFPQPERAFLKEAPKLFKETAEINWNQSCQEIVNFVRGMNPHPAAWTTLEGKTYKIFKVKLSEPTEGSGNARHSKEGLSYQTDQKSYWKIQASDGWIDLCEIQPEGKRKMSIDEFLRGYRWPDTQ